MPHCHLAPLTPESFNLPREGEVHSIVPVFDGVMVDLFTCSHFTKFKKTPVLLLYVITEEILGKFPELFYK